MPTVSIQSSLAAGELAPSLLGRVDLQKYTSGTSTCRNFFVNYRGGVESRAGLAYVGTCKQPGTSAPPRDIPFQFSITQGYVLEFGDYYMRVKYNGAYVTESPETISGITQANPAVININSHGYSVGDWIYIENIVGMTYFNGLTWIVSSVVDTNHIEVTDLFGNSVNSTLFPAYVSGGTAARIYTNTSAPYAAVDLPYLKYTESADTMTLTCVNTATQTQYPPYELARISNTDWTFTQSTFSATISAPTGLSGNPSSSSTQTTWYSYVVTAVNDNTGEESVASAPCYVYNNDIAQYSGSNNLVWNSVSGATSYKVYKATPSYAAQVSASSLYGFVGYALGEAFTDTNITADFTQVPPTHNNPFAIGAITAVNITAQGDGNYDQTTVGYTVSTSTGSGFAGTPIVSNGKIVGFNIQNGGQNYAPTDTITFTDSGGGKATGTMTFTANPSPGSNVVYLNNLSLSWVAAPATTQQTAIQGSSELTCQETADFLNSTLETSWAVASYSASGNVLTITYKQPGTAGNGYTLQNSSAPVTFSGTTLTGGGTAGTGATGTLSIGVTTGTYPSVCAYYQQRRVYGSSLNYPDEYWMSKPGLFKNFDVSTPTVADDSISGSPWSQQVNGIQWLVPMPGGLVVLTGKGAWQVTGGSQAAITPSNQDAIPQAYNGVNNLVPPITINYDILYVQAKGSIVRDLSYNFFVNIYTGTDLTVLSNHLFLGNTITQWAWSEEPYKIVWAVRDDGILLSLTYLKEQDVYAWTRHDTNGLFVSVASVTEPPVDAVYVITKRYVQGAWRYYSERMDNRIWNNVEDSFCADSALTNTINYPNATLTPAVSTGTNNISSVLVINGGKNYTSPKITAVDSTGSGSNATFTATVSSGVITAITPTTDGQNYTPGYTELVITDSTGSGAIAQPIITNNVNFVASSSVFTSANVGDVIRVGGGKATVTSYVSGTEVVANITQPITQTVPNDPNNLPVPAAPNNWSISTPITTVTNLNHLEGLEVCILADGSVVPNQTVTNNSITLPYAASKIVIGLPYVCQVQTMYLDYPGQSTIQNRRKNITSVGVRVANTRGIQIGADQPDASAQQNNATIPWTNMQEIKERNNLVSAGSAVPLYTGDHFKNITSGWDVRGQIAIQQTYPLPATILAVMAYWTPGDDA